MTEAIQDTFDAVDVADKKGDPREKAIVYPEDNCQGNGPSTIERTKTQTACHNVTAKSYRVTVAKHNYCEIILWPLSDCKGVEQGNTNFRGSHSYTEPKREECNPPRYPVYFGLFRSASLNCTDDPHDEV